MYRSVILFEEEEEEKSLRNIMGCALCEKRRWRWWRRWRPTTPTRSRDDEFFITSFSGVGAFALQMTYAYKKSEHHDVAHSLFGNFEMDNSINNELRKAVLRLAARARHGRNPDWLRRLRRISRENLITQLRLVLRQTGYRAIVRLYNAFAHSREVQRVIEDDVFEHSLGGLHVFRGISLAHEERLGKSKNIFFFFFLNNLPRFFIYSFREPPTR